MNSVHKSISLGIIYFIGFGYHPVLKIKSPLLWGTTGLHPHVNTGLHTHVNTGLHTHVNTGLHPHVNTGLHTHVNTGLHTHVKIKLKLPGWFRPVKLFSVVGLI